MNTPSIDTIEDEAELAQLAEVFSELQRYTLLRQQAVKFRRQGYIAVAIGSEIAMDAIYKALPDWAKW